MVLSSQSDKQEIFRTKLIKGFKSDIWSFGIMCYKIFANRFPYSSKVTSKESLFFEIVNKSIYFPSSFTSTQKKFLRMLLKKREDKRANIEEVLQFLKTKLNCFD